MVIPTQISAGTKATLIGAVANLILAGIKFIGGVIGNSTALVADALHSLSDLLTDAVVLATHQIGKIPADSNHPYGHGRAETLGATVVGSLIILAGIWIGYDVWKVIASGSQLVPTLLAASMATLSIIINEALFQYTRIIGKRENSPSLIANAWHHRSDAISSIAALVGILGAHFGYPIMDPLAGGIVALMIIKVGYDILSGGVLDLMDTGLEEEKTKRIKEIIDGIPDVLKFHDLRTRKLGGEVFMDVHILVDTDLTVSEGHTIAERVRRRLINEFNELEDVLVHVDAEEDQELLPLNPATREDLKPIVDPIMAQFNGLFTKTRLRVHHAKGKTIVELYLETNPERTIGEVRSMVQDLEKRLVATQQIDKVQIFLDLNS